MRRPLATAALALMLLAGSAAGTTSGEPPAVRWQGWDAGLKDAARVQRPVLIDVYTGWCGWCKRMDHDVYSRAEVRDYLARRFVTVKLDAEASDAGVYDGKSYTSATLAGKFRVTGYPTTIFLRANGEHLVNVPGYVPADRFLLLLRYIGEGAMDRDVSFDDFVKSESAR